MFAGMAPAGGSMPNDVTTATIREGEPPAKPRAIAVPVPAPRPAGATQKPGGICNLCRSNTLTLLAGTVSQERPATSPNRPGPKPGPDARRSHLPWESRMPTVITQHVERGSTSSPRERCSQRLRTSGLQIDLALFFRSHVSRPALQRKSSTRERAIRWVSQQQTSRSL